MTTERRNIFADTLYVRYIVDYRRQCWCTVRIISALHMPFTLIDHRFLRSDQGFRRQQNFVCGDDTPLTSNCFPGRVNAIVSLENRSGLAAYE
jgi:hypothetical protein